MRSPSASLLDRYEAMRVREGQRIKALPKAMRLLRLHLKPYLGLPADRVLQGRSARGARQPDRGRHRHRGQPHARLARPGDALGERGRFDPETNIVPAIRRTPETKRERVLTKKEIAAIWKACDKLGPHEVAINYGRMVRFLLVTAQRRDEAASLKFGDILDGTWRQIENKASRPHSLPLPPLAWTLVGKGDARDYVFGGRLGKIGGFSRLKGMLDKASGVSDWRLHDLRRTAATNMQELGIRDDMVQAVLNHSLQGVAAVYLRCELEKQKAEALATWAVALAKIVRPMTLVAS